MNSSPLSIHSFPRAILHIDGDAFFASCEQARDPALAGKPVITGAERGIAASMSYEAKARGVTRGMRLFEIRKICPDAIILPSDYETYSLLSKRFFDIVRRYTSDVEEYSIDECFADLTGLRRPHRKSYREIAESIRSDLARELGFTFSAGLAPNKVIAKIGSKWKKPNGFTAIPGYEIHTYLEKLPTEKIWGIGPQTSAHLAKFNIHTSLEFARRPEEWVREHFTKPIFEIWQELNGRFILPISTEEKQTYASIQKMKTFTPPSSNRNFVFAQLSKNIENACMKARRYKLAAPRATFFLRTQEFDHSGIEIELSRATAFPNDIIAAAEKSFDDFFDPKHRYRATGVVLIDLASDDARQLDIFDGNAKIQKLHSLYEGVDKLRAKFGKHMLFLGSSFSANRAPQHAGDRGKTPARKLDLFRGETARRRLAIPMFLGEVK